MNLRKTENPEGYQQTRKFVLVTYDNENNQVDEWRVYICTTCGTLVGDVFAHDLFHRNGNT